MGTHTKRNSTFGTLAGISALLMWSTNIAFSKSVMNDIGNYYAMFMIYFFGGIFMFLVLLASFRREYFPRLRALGIRYYAGTGIFLFLNNTLLFIALGLTTNEKELLIVTIINYLWPMLIYIMKIPVFHIKVRPIAFIISVILGISGVILAFSQEYTLRELAETAKSLDENFLAYILALITAVSWGLYSNLTKKYITDDDFAAIPVIFIISGLPFLIMMLSRGEFEFNRMLLYFTNPELIYTIIFPTALGYILWNVAMKKGNKDLVVSASFMLPFFSVLFIGLKFSIRIGLLTWIASAFLISGAFLIYRAVDRKGNRYV
jgi:drug/metabolite transporter (DMT)-like permease